MNPDTEHDTTINRSDNLRGNAIAAAGRSRNCRNRLLHERW